MGIRRNYRLAPEDDPQWLRFWSWFPRRVAKKEARKAWAELNPTPETVNKMLETLAWQCRQPEWLKDGGQFVPYPATWLRAERWDDEPVEIQILTEKTVRTLTSAAQFIRGGNQ